jgi:hypothetical protein
MIKLVVSYSIGDGFEFSGTDHTPVEYESAEALLVDIEEHVKKYMAVQKELSDFCHALDIHKITPEQSAKINELQLALNQKGFIKHTALHPEMFIEPEIGGKMIFEAPQIRTLEEWFDDMSKQPNYS